MKKGIKIDYTLEGLEYRNEPEIWSIRVEHC
jgi:hypothetical protein